MFDWATGGTPLRDRNEIVMLIASVAGTKPDVCRPLLDPLTLCWWPEKSIWDNRTTVAVAGSASRLARYT